MTRVVYGAVCRPEPCIAGSADALFLFVLFPSLLMVLKGSDSLFSCVFSDFSEFNGSESLFSFVFLFVSLWRLWFYWF